MLVLQSCHCHLLFPPCKSHLLHPLQPGDRVQRDVEESSAADEFGGFVGTGQSARPAAGQHDRVELHGYDRIPFDMLKER